MQSSVSSSFRALPSLGNCSSNLKAHYFSSFFFNPKPITTSKRPSLLLTQQPSRKLLCRPPAGKYVSEDYLVKKISAKEVEALVKGERNVPLIIDFYATWCGPCILMAQELETLKEFRINKFTVKAYDPLDQMLGFLDEFAHLAVEYENNVLIVKVDTDNEYEFASDMQVRGLPTLYFISPNPSKDAIRTEGLIPIQMIRDIIENEM